ncbi:MAG: cation-translocating P-type ATPase [Bdellovibrio sp.]
MKKKVSFKNLKDVEKRPEGLFNSDVDIQRARYGKNEIVEALGKPWLALIRETIKDPMIWFLIIISVAFTVVGEYREATILFLAMLPLLLMDAILHRRIQASTTNLRAQLATEATVLREGQTITINTVDVVPGDIIIVSSGDFLPADGFFESAQDLQVDESALTGESLPVAKKHLPLNAAELTDYNSIGVDANTLGFAGTRALTGTAKLRILFTGRDTSYGEIVQSVSSIQQERTPLQKSIFNLVRVLIYVAIGFCILLAGVRIYQGHGWLDALLSSATLAMAAIPEEFPVVFTFFLGVGVYRLAKKRALVRRAVSVENIGRITAICTDKTGTITLGQLKLTNYDQANGVSRENLLQVAALSSKPLGTDPVDQAIWEMVQNTKLKVQERHHVFPFTEGKKREASFAYDLKGEAFCYMKGAPEVIFGKCKLQPDEINEWLNKTSDWAKQGNKVLACAFRKLSEQEFASKTEPENDFQLAGLLTFADPTRPEVAGAMSYCHQNSIGVWMITGDHIETAMAIARNVGLNGGENLKGISGEDEPHKLQEQFLRKNPDFLKQVHVIARCNPLQKLEIIKALHDQQELIAVTGDGINDVPALKASDIGIAMGDGTRSAKEVSAIILLDNNFSTIINAIKEGRQLYLNLKMSFEYLLLIHIPFVLTAALIPLLGYPLLYLPIHIVWLELIIHPTALFAFMQNVNPAGVLSHSRNSINFFTKKEGLRIGFIGLGMSMAIALSFLLNFTQSSNVYHARAQAFAILIFWSAAVVLYITRLKSSASRFIFFATIVSAVAGMQIPSVSAALSLAPLHIQDWTFIFLILIIFVLIFSLLKKSEREKSSANHANCKTIKN